jgi:hypothetical protein
MTAHEFLLVLLGFACGGKLGIWMTERRWRANAKAIQRIESGGKLYKVTEA